MIKRKDATTWTSDTLHSLPIALVMLLLLLAVVEVTGVGHPHENEYEEAAK